MPHPALALLVALETSTRSPSVAVRHGEQLLQRELASERAHASDLVPALDELLRELGAAPGAIEAVLVGLGPGSYTGLRVGVATALGLARGCGARLAGVPSGEVLAWDGLPVGAEGWHLVDVRQGALALARYRRVEDDVEVLEPPRLVPRAEAARELTGDARVFADEGSARALEGDPALAARVVSGVAPSAAALLGLAEARRAAGRELASGELEPLYLREFRAMPRRR